MFDCPLAIGTPERGCRMSRISSLQSSLRHSAICSRHSSMTKINVSVSDGISVIELNDPPANTYSYEMMQEIDAAVLDARMDPSVHVIVLIGAGEKFFCA